MEQHSCGLPSIHAHLLSLEISSRKAASLLQAHQLGHFFIPQKTAQQACFLFSLLLVLVLMPLKLETLVPNPSKLPEGWGL